MSNSIAHRKIVLSNQEIESHGCKHCLWLIHGQCKHGYSLNSIGYHSNGVCEEYLQFLFNFAEPGDSATAMWEKFLLFQSRLQVNEDYMKYKRMEKEIADFKSDPRTSRDNDQIKALEMKCVMLRAFWTSLLEQTLKAHTKVVDREQKVNDAAQVPRLTVQQLNVMISDSAEKLLNYENLKSKEVKE